MRTVLFHWSHSQSAAARKVRSCKQHQLIGYSKEEHRSITLRYIKRVLYSETVKLVLKTHSDIEHSFEQVSAAMNKRHCSDDVI